MDKSSNDDEKNTSNGGGGSSGTDLPPVSEGEEEGEDDMLAACINIGMQNNRLVLDQNYYWMSEFSHISLVKFKINILNLSIGK